MFLFVRTWRVLMVPMILIFDLRVCLELTARRLWLGSLLTLTLWFVKVLWLCIRSVRRLLRLMSVCRF